MPIDYSKWEILDRELAAEEAPEECVAGCGQQAQSSRDVSEDIESDDDWATDVDETSYKDFTIKRTSRVVKKRGTDAFRKGDACPAKVVMHLCGRHSAARAKGFRWAPRVPRCARMAVGTSLSFTGFCVSATVHDDRFGRWAVRCQGRGRCPAHQIVFWFFWWKLVLEDANFMDLREGQGPCLPVTQKLSMQVVVRLRGVHRGRGHGEEGSRAL